MPERPVAFIVGASRGMGRATAIDLARHGYDIAAAARSSSGSRPAPAGTVEHTIEKVTEHGARGLAMTLDLGEHDDVGRATDEVLEHFGRIDLLVTMANWVDFSPGGSYSSRFAEARWESIASHVSLTVLGHLHLLQRVLPVMLSQQRGIIVNITQNRSATVSPPPAPGPAVFDPPLMERLARRTDATKSTRSGSVMVPVTRGATERIAPALAGEVEAEGVVILTLDPGMTLSNPGMEEFYTGIRHSGFDLEVAHSVLVPARAITYIATCRNPKVFSGKFVVAEDLVRRFGLMFDSEVFPPVEVGPPPVESLPPMRGFDHS